MRSRWSAVGAAVAITLGGGGLFVAQAATAPESSVVTIEPVRILDSRDPIDLGLAGPFSSTVGLDLQVTGSIPTPTGNQVVVPEGATGVLLNVTAIRPETAGFISVRPADATGNPTTSNLNFDAGDVVPNSVTVQLPTSGAEEGRIEITYDAGGLAGPTTNIAVDVFGYLIEGAAGPAGPAGDVGPAGPSIGGVDYVNGVGAVPLDDTAQIIQQISITAPEDGTAVVTATFMANLPGGRGMRCMVTLDPTVDTASFFTNGDTQRYLPFARTKGFDVEAGTTTVYLVCTGNPAGMGVVQDIYAHNMTAVYSPNQV